VVEENKRSPEFDHLCEHIPFNRGVLKHGVLYVCRDMKVDYEPVGFKALIGAFLVGHGKERELQIIRRIYRKVITLRDKINGRSE
jgi:hypothetical protein